MTFREQIVRGGTFLVFRQGMGTILSFLSVLLVTRVIGPANYGVFASAIGIENAFYNISQLGIGVYLIRNEIEVEDYYHQAFSLLLGLGLMVIILTVVFLPLLVQWINMEMFESVARLLFFALPFRLLSLVPLARLEKSMAYHLVARVELGGQIASLAVAVSLAFLGKGVWAPTSGWITQNVLVFLLLYWIARYKPMLIWKKELIRPMLSYSLGYSASMWIWQLRNLVKPLVVGRFAGAEGVGIIALAVRLVEILSFAKHATWRLSIAVLARLQQDKHRLLRALKEGSELQVLMISPLLLAVALAGPFLLPLLFGAEWTDVMRVFPFIALAYTTNTLFNLISSALFVLRYNWAVTWFHLVHVIILFGMSFLFVPERGVVGYGWAEIVAFTAYGLLYYQIGKRVGKVQLSLPMLWTFTFGLAYFWNWLGWISFIPLIAVFLLPNSRNTILAHWNNSLKGVLWKVRS